MATPIFVIGKQRSGTTWLGNLLSEHPDIAAVQHEVYFGIVESKYFSHVYGRYGALHERTNYVEFVQALTSMDYFKLAGATRDIVYDMDIRNYAEVFRAIMDRYAGGQGRSYWVEKTPMHTLWMEKLARFYPDAKFVAVVREPGPVVASSLSGKYRFWTHNRPLSIMRTVQDWRLYKKTIEHFAGKSPDRIMVVEYNDLRKRTDTLLKEICAFIGMPYVPEMQSIRYAPNTSFASEAERGSALSASDRRLIRAAAGGSRFAPLWTLSLFESIRRSVKGRPPLPESSFRLVLSSRSGRGPHAPQAVESLSKLASSPNMGQ